MVITLPSGLATLLPADHAELFEVGVPGWPSNEATLVDSRSTLRRYQDATASGLPLRERDALSREGPGWNHAARKITEYTQRIASDEGRTPMAYLTFRHRLLTVNHVNLQSLLDRQQIWVACPEPVASGLATDYVDQARQFRPYATVLVTVTPGPFEMDVVVPEEAGITLASDWSASEWSRSHSLTVELPRSGTYRHRAENETVGRMHDRQR